MMVAGNRGPSQPQAVGAGERITRQALGSCGARRAGGRVWGGPERVRDPGAAAASVASGASRSGSGAGGGGGGRVSGAR